MYVAPRHFSEARNRQNTRAEYVWSKCKGARGSHWYRVKVILHKADPYVCFKPKQIEHYIALSFWVSSMFPPLIGFPLLPPQCSRCYKKPPPPSYLRETETIFDCNVKDFPRRFYWKWTKSSIIEWKMLFKTFTWELRMNRFLLTTLLSIQCCSTLSISVLSS